MGIGDTKAPVALASGVMILRDVTSQCQVRVCIIVYRVVLIRAGQSIFYPVVVEALPR
jgi:hypothetical protein